MKFNPTKLMLSVLGACAAVFVIILITNLILYRDINRSVTVEAGSAFPDASVFIRDPGGDASYITDVSRIDSGKPGVSQLKIRYEGRTYHVRLRIEDTVAPAAQVRALDLYDGETAAAEDFVFDVKDAQPVDIRFETTPDFTKKSVQPVVILLSDPSGNQAKFQTTLRISKLKESVLFEATTEPLDIRSLLKRSDETGETVWAGEQPSLNHVGDFPVKVSVDGAEYESLVKVVDTAPPAGTALSKTFWMDEEIQASDFVENIADVTDVTVAFETAPDFTKIGEQPVKLVLTDEGSNRTVLDGMLTIRNDSQAPVIYASNRCTVYIGQAVAYKKGVYAVDDRDGDVEVTVDSSKVNPKLPGEYKVTYSAVDSSGNAASVDVPVTVKEQTVDMAALEALADEVLAKITTAGMDMRQKAWAIYEYTNKHISYTGTSDKTDWMKEAWRGISQGVGDCFTYYSVSNILLIRAGFEVLSVERQTKPGEAHHYWHMVFCNGAWYHFDSCIHKPPMVSFMLTDKQLADYSALQGRDNYYYRYDRSQYPSTPEAPLPSGP